MEPKPLQFAEKAPVPKATGPKAVTFPDTTTPAPMLDHAAAASANAQSAFAELYSSKKFSIDAQIKTLVNAPVLDISSFQGHLLQQAGDAITTSSAVGMLPVWEDSSKAISATAERSVVDRWMRHTAPARPIGDVLLDLYEVYKSLCAVMDELSHLRERLSVTQAAIASVDDTFSSKVPEPMARALHNRRTLFAFMIQRLDGEVQGVTQRQALAVERIGQLQQLSVLVKGKE